MRKTKLLKRAGQLLSILPILLLTLTTLSLDTNAAYQQVSGGSITSAYGNGLDKVDLGGRNTNSALISLCGGSDIIDLDCVNQYGYYGGVYSQVNTYPKSNAVDHLVYSPHDSTARSNRGSQPYSGMGGFDFDGLCQSGSIQRVGMLRVTLSVVGNDTDASTMEDPFNNWATTNVEDTNGSTDGAGGFIAIGGVTAPVDIDPSGTKGKAMTSPPALQQYELPNSVARGYENSAPDTGEVVFTSDNGGSGFTKSQLDGLVLGMYVDGQNGSAIEITKASLEADSVTCSTAVSDLSLTKTIEGSSTGTVGSEVTFKITLKNDGPDDATNVEVTDKLPAGLTYLSSQLSVGQYEPGTGIWTIPQIANGATQTLTIKARVDSIPDSGIENIAEVTKSDSSDPDSDPNNCDKGAKLEDDCGRVRITKTPPTPQPPKTGALVGASIATAALLGMIILGSREYINKRALKTGSEK